MSLDQELEPDRAAPGPRRALAATSPHRPPVDRELRWVGPLGLRLDPPDALTTAAWADEHAIAGRLDLERAAALGPLDELVAPDLFVLEPAGAPVELVRRFFADLDGRGIVVQPDGPEASMILPLVLGELAARGLGDRMLVTGAPGTVERIALDLHDGLDLALGVARATGDAALHEARVVLDHDLAEAEVDQLAARPWDVVVVDAAHQVAGDDASHVRLALARLLRDARWVLLLTPAPARDDLIELRRLVELVRPGTFRPDSEFRARLVDPDVRHTAARPDELRRLVAPVLVRTPRAERTSSLRGRVVERHEVELTDEEDAVVAQAVDLVAGPLAGPEGWEARRILVPRIADPGPGLVDAANAAAERAPDDDARAGLLDLATAAAALDEDGPRARLLVTLVRLWESEHGRVLVATASPGNARSLHQRLEDAGLSAVLLHEQLPRSAQADAVRAWREHDDAVVLVATDATLRRSDLGTGGCVVCADLPWDPVVVDDRLAALGAVGDDDLVVATFVAADTVDATVADVMVDQVELFRHGAGWPRTLLAELDPSTGPVADGEAPVSFSDRLVLALTEDPADVAAALEDLADDLEAARHRVRLLVESADRIDEWIEPDPVVPAEVAPVASVAADDDELDDDGFFGPAPPAATPAASAAPPSTIPLPVRSAFPRAAALRDALARWAVVSGGQVLSDEPSHLVTDGVLGASPGRWVFDRAGAGAHPDAELVAPGSPALAMLLEEVRSSTPVRACVAEPVDLPMIAAGDHAEAITLVDRLVEAPSSWSATATWRVRSGATREELVEVVTGEPPAGRSDRRPLDDRESLPSELPDADEIVECLLEDAGAALAAVAAATSAAATSAAEAARARLLVHHHAAVDAARAVIEETVAGTPEHERATEQLRSLHADHPADGSAGPDPRDGRVRATLVAVQVEAGDDFVVVERWRHDGGAEAEVRYPWDADGVAVRRSEVSDEPVAILALCRDGHVVDEGELVWCSGCERHGCAACGVPGAVAPCPTCGTEVCGECRMHDDRFGPCRQCRDPRRDEAGDTDRAVAWHLGGEATLLVGARWAELRLAADAEPTVLVPDEDVDDPARRRLRSAADALGLPPDVGAGVGPRGPSLLPQRDDAWMATVAGATWKVVDGRGPEVVADFVAFDDFDGPDGPEPLVQGEGASGVAGVLARARAEAPPPPPPAFVRTPHVDVERTTVVASGLVRTLDRVGGDGTVERLDEAQADLLGVPGATGHLFRSVAAAALGPVELVLARLHRSTIIRVTTPTGTTEWFVAPEPHLTFGGELAWASWAEDEGLADGAVLTVGEDRPVLADDELAAPGAVTLQHRAVVDVWGAEPIADADADADVDAGATDLDLALVGYEEVPDLAMPSPAPERSDLAKALHERGREVDEVGEHPHRLAHRWFDVEESWLGRSPVRLAYKVAPGEPAWPRLDDTHERASDFEVDDHGHLHEPDTGWECLACGEHHCRACGPVGAMEDCGSCEQPACGLCRARTPRDVPEQWCDRCGARSCADCGRVPDATACGVCRRSVCSRCREEQADGTSRCGPCARLRSAVVEEVDGLPPVLAAHGMHVQLGHDGTELVVVLLGAWRTEVAIVREGAVSWWVHLDEVDEPIRRLLLAAARRWPLPGDLVAVPTGSSTSPAVAGPGLLLVAEEVPEVRWSVEAGDLVLGGSPVAPRPRRAAEPPNGSDHETGVDDDDGGEVEGVEADAGAAVDAPAVDGALDGLEVLAVLDAEVAEAVAKEIRAGATPALSSSDLLPVPAPAGSSPAGPDPIAERRAGLRLDEGGRVLVEDRRRATATWLTPDGLERLVSEGDDDRRTTAPWQVGVRFAWMTEGWEPQPNVVAYALLAGFEAALVRVGRHLALGVRGDDRVVWWILRDEPGDLQRTLLGAHLTGEERLLDLRVVTDPGKVEGPTVLDATFIDRNIEPVLEEVGEGEGDPDEALRAAAAWVRRDAAAPDATGPPLPPDLVAGLVARADELSPPTLETVGIALQVVETWRQGLDEFPVPYRLTPGSTVGTIVCADTEGPSRVVRRDRSGHLVAEAVRCPSCDAESCVRCHVRVQPCSVCADAVCGSCALDDGRCPTCALLGLLDRKDAKRLGLKVGRRAVVLRSQVGPRTVLAVHDGDWSVTVEEAGAVGAPPPDEGRTALLDRIVASPPTVVTEPVPEPVPDAAAEAVPAPGLSPVVPADVPSPPGAPSTG